MSLAPGWDRRDKRTLRFVDADLERAFQEATLEPFRHRIAAVGSVVISEATYRLIEPMAVVTELGTPQLKGRTEATVVYELHALRGPSSSVDNPA